ncbi:1-acyl-sn-glycerol-3-phosphate acyltransferase gamma-like isoform X2 [Hetaerina americana]
MESMLIRLKRSPVSHLLLAITFFSSGLAINLFQSFLWVFIRPVSKHVYRKVNYYLEYSLYSELVFLCEWWSGSDIKLYINKEEFIKYYGKEHGYLVMNHTYEIDWMVGWMFCERIGVLGNCKSYAKKVIQYVPTIGWAWKFAESIFLERDWDKDKETIGKQIKELVEYPDPIWLLLYAEGTRFTPEKHKASLEFAKEKGLPELKHHLTPRTKGFVCSVPYLKEKFGAIYEVQLAFKKSDVIKPTLNNLLMGKKVMAHMYINRIPMDEVPAEEVACAQFLKNLYLKKDKMQDSFYKTGDFFEESGVTRTDEFILPRRPYSFLNTAGWGIAVLCPMTYILLGLLTSGSTIQFALGVGIIAIFFFLLYKLIGMTKISKASSYGMQDKRSPSKKTE